jgi:GTP cyclohydrolase III
MVFAKSIKMLDGTVKTSHTDVVKASGVMTQKLKCYKSFLSDRVIRGSCCTDSNLKGWMCGRFGFRQG